MPPNPRKKIIILNILSYEASGEVAASTSTNSMNKLAEDSLAVNKTMKTSLTLTLRILLILIFNLFFPEVEFNNLKGRKPFSSASLRGENFHTGFNVLELNIFEHANIIQRCSNILSATIIKELHFSPTLCRKLTEGGKNRIDFTIGIKMSHIKYFYDPLICTYMTFMTW